MAKKKTRPPKIENFLSVVKKCIETGCYRRSAHSCIRGEQRGIDFSDIKYVLKNGRHEITKTQYDEAFNTWKYAVRGNTLEGRDIRVIIAFDADIMYVITVINLSEG